MTELSVIIPFVNEWPLIAATVANIAEELRDRVDFEIIAIDNWCAQVAKQGRNPDRGHEHMHTVAKGHPWLKVLKYEEKLSHWQAKNLGVRESSGKFLFFCDAHCIVSRDALACMLAYYREHSEELNGTLHLPLTYHLLEWRTLIYKLVARPEDGFFHYSFDQGGYKKRAAEANGATFEVPCMSTCGMLMSREIYDELGGWPEGLGIYGGGENFINFTLAILGRKINIFPGPPLRHHGERRGYSYNWQDMQRNRLLATMMFGGVKHMRRFQKKMKGNAALAQRLGDQAVVLGREQRDMIKTKQVIEIDDWVETWKK